MFSVLKDYYCAKRTPYNAADEESVEGKVVLITGSNSGIGKVAALEFAKRGAVVIMACRDVGKAQKVLDEIKQKSGNSGVELVGLDLEDLSSVRKCAQEIREKYDHINILINNAGLYYEDGVTRKTKDGFEVHMGVNHLGHVLFTMLLLDLVKKGAPGRIVVVASMGFQMAEIDFDDLMCERRGTAWGFGNVGPYANSKLANMYFAGALAKELKGTGITTHSLCPGNVKTDIYRNDKEGFLSRIARKAQGCVSISPEEGAENILYCALSKKCGEDTGKMHRFNNSWKEADKVLNDVQTEKKLWDVSLKLVGFEHKH